MLKLLEAGMRREIYSVQATPLDMSELGAGATAPSEEWIQVRFPI